MTSDTKPKVFCKDCRHHYVYKYGDGYTESRCVVALVKVSFDPVEGRVQVNVPLKPHEDNKDFDCSYHTPFGAERIRPGSSYDEPSRTSPALFGMGASLVAFGVLTVVVGLGLRMLAIIMVGCVALLVGALFLWLGDS